MKFDLPLNEIFFWVQEKYQTLSPGAYDNWTGEQVADDARPESFGSLVSFFHDRLKVYLRDKGARHDLIDAALASAVSTSTTTPHPEEHVGSDMRLEGRGDPASSKSATGESRVLRDATPSGVAPQDEGRLGGATSNDDLLMIVRRVEALGRSSTPRTARTCSPATSARPTSCASRRRRTAAPTPSRSTRHSCASAACRRRRCWRKCSTSPKATPGSMSRARISRAR